MTPLLKMFADIDSAEHYLDCATMAVQEAERHIDVARAKLHGFLRPVLATFGVPEDAEIISAEMQDNGRFRVCYETEGATNALTFPTAVLDAEDRLTAALNALNALKCDFNC